MFPDERIAIVERSFKSDSDRPPKKGRSVSFSAVSLLIGDKLGKEFHKPFNDLHILPKEPRRCRMQPKKKAAPSGARLSAIAHLAAATTTSAMMMHEFYGRGAA